MVSNKQRAAQAQEDRLQEALQRERERDEVREIFIELSDRNEATGKWTLDQHELARILHKLGYRAWTT